MAFDAQGNIIDPNEDENTVVPKVSVPGQPVFTGGGTAAPSVSQPSKTPSTSGFTNLQQYLAANKSSPMAGTIGQRIGQLSSGIQTGIGKSLAETKQQSQQGSTFLQPGWQNIVGQARYGEEGQTGELPTFPTDYSQSVQGTFGLPSEEQYKQYAGYTGAQYKGPQDLSNKYQLQSQVGQLRNVIGQSSPDSLLRRYVGTGQYTPGQERLDKLILGQTVNPQQYRSIANQAQMSFNKAQQEALANIAYNKSRTEATKQIALNEVQKALGQSGDKTGLLGDLQTRTGNIQEQEKTLRDYIQNNPDLLKKLNLDLPKNVLDALGLKSEQKIQGVGQQEMLEAIPTYGRISSVTPEDIATQQDLARYQALQRLSGRQDISPVLQAGEQLGAFTREVGQQKFTPDELREISERAQKQYEGAQTPEIITSGQIRGGLSAQYGSIENAQKRMAELQSYLPYGGLSAAAYGPGTAQRQYWGELQDLQNKFNELARLNASTSIEALKEKYGIGRTIGQPTQTITQS